MKDWIILWKYHVNNWYNRYWIWRHISLSHSALKISWDIQLYHRAPRGGPLASPSILQHSYSHFNCSENSMFICKCSFQNRSQLLMIEGLPSISPFHRKYWSCPSLSIGWDLCVCPHLPWTEAIKYRGPDLTLLSHFVCLVTPIFWKYSCNQFDPNQGFFRQWVHLLRWFCFFQYIHFLQIL